jgi:D-3-phosphoglycerate dehydrogenase
MTSIHQYAGLIVATRIKVDRDLIDKAIQLKFIARGGSGMENIDVDYATTKNIITLNSPEGNANAVGEHALALLLAFYHNISRSFAQIQNGKWLTEENRVHELEGRVIGIIGYGNTGRAFARMLKPLHLTVLAYDKYISNYSDDFVLEATMEEICKNAEILSLHIPLTSETLQLVDQEFLIRFEKELFLINTSRGKIVNHEHLLQQINAGKIVGAALDVFENEKFETHTSHDQQVFQALIDTGKVIFTPHIAGKSFESKKKIAAVLLEKIKAIL